MNNLGLITWDIWLFHVYWPECLYGRLRQLEMKEVMPMKIGFVGAGRVGFSLGKYLQDQGVEVAGYCSRSIQSARDAATFTGSRVFGSVRELLPVCDMLFLTVPDAAIRQCYEELQGESIRGKILCHASGAMSASEAFPDIEARGAYGYSVHPLFAVSDRYGSYRQMGDIFFTLEGSATRQQWMLDWLRQMGLRVQPIEAVAKARYHAAAAVASNHAVALFAEAQELLEDCGFSSETAQEALGPIFAGNACQVADRGPVEALTGPVQRGDAATVAKHLGVLDSAEDRMLYILLSRRLMKLARRKNPAYASEKLTALLDREYAIALGELQGGLDSMKKN